MKKETKILIGISAVAAVTAAAASVLTLNMLSDMAVAKKLPRAATRARKRMNSAIMDEDSFEMGREAAKALEARPHTRIELINREGLRLIGHWFPTREQKRVVLCMHGWRSGWSFDFSGAVDFLQGEGCSLLMVEQRCHGDSEGEFIGFGVYERYDCLDWLEKARELAPDTPVYLLGISMGATSVLMAAGLELPDCVRGVIADCGFTSPRAIWSHVMKNDLKISDKLAYPIANYFISKKAGYDGEQATTVEAMKSCTVPVLFIHGDADRFVPHSMTLEAHDACASDRTLLIVHGAGHGLSYYVDTETYQRHVREFFAKNDNAV